MKNEKIKGRIYDFINSVLLISPKYIIINLTHIERYLFFLEPKSGITDKVPYMDSICLNDFLCYLLQGFFCLHKNILLH